MIQNIVTVDKSAVWAFARSWVKALRSGEYAQTRNVLIRADAEGNTSHCCLGVACEVSGLSRTEFDGAPVGYKLVHGSNGSLPPLLREAVGITPEFEKTLAQANDIDRRPFNEIADMIEEYYRDNLGIEVTAPVD